MTVKIMRVPVLAIFLVLLVCVQGANGEGWLFWNSSGKKNTQTKKAVLKNERPQPSMLEKINLGTKKFFYGVGVTLGLKKSAPKRPVEPYNPWIKPAKREPSKPSWLTSLFFKEKPKKPKTASEWLDQPRLDP